MGIKVKEFTVEEEIEEENKFFKYLANGDEFKERILLDWWGECRTCDFWVGDRKDMGKEPGVCKKKISKLYNQETWWEGHCEFWYFYEDKEVK